MNGLLGPVTANRNMLAQALRSRQKPPMELRPVTPQGLLDNAALATSPVPFVGDVVGLAADANRFYNEPESRTPLNFGLAALGLIPFLPPLVSAGLGKFAQSQGKTLSAPSMTGPGRNQAGAIVYHGSPHKFDKFDSSKIGTGEGAQAYGHGLYFAENPGVAKSYQQALSSSSVLIDGKPAQYLKSKQNHSGFDKAVKQLGLDEQESKEAASLLSLYKHNGGDWGRVRELVNGYTDYFRPKSLAVLDKIEPRVSSKYNGNLYKVDLPDEAIAKMLDWDKPLSQQAPEVQKALNSSWLAHPDAHANLTGRQIYQMNGVGLGSDIDGTVGAADRLKKAGIPGVRYLDGGSRSAGEGTRNFVVFPGNEGLLKILSRE